MTLRILHVEDNPFDADLTLRQLKRQAADIAVDPAVNLAEARHKLATPENYDLVLADLKLPDGNGLELLAEIRQRQLPLAVVMLTGSGDQEAAIAALKAGADDYLTKGGASLQQLGNVLQSALQRFRADSRRWSQPLRVLYAEHNPADIDLARRHLARHAPHIQMTVVASAEQVLSRLPEQDDTAAEFDVLLLDFRLPGLDALGLTKLLRQERGLTLPIVLISGQGNEDIAVQALRLGIDDFIIKHDGYLHELPACLEKVQRQAELERYRQHLEQLVAARTAELEAALQRAEQLARTKSAFLANMSHEIRTPLNGVLGFAQIGFRDSAGQEKLQTDFRRILDSGRLLLGIINDILDFSKIDAGKLKIEPVATDLTDLLRQLLDTFQAPIQAKGIKLLVKKDRSLPAHIVCDPLRLEQIMLNLVSNALKFTERGEIELSVTREGDRLLLRLRDTGIGMDAEQLSRIFDPFEQAESQTARKYGGTGLGLSIVRRLVALMQGEIQVESRPGEGSRFSVTLPLIEPNHPPLAATTAPAPSAPAGTRLAGLRLLVAEDNEINRIVLNDMLTYEGAQVTLAVDGQDVVQRFGESGRAAFDLILMDVSMPVMDGYEAARRIHALAPDMPIIGQTAYAMPEEKAACLAAGMLDHLAKPLDIEALVQAVSRHLSGVTSP
jgi:signal transduction histidine kinase/two-component SAPR family response regulator